MSENKTAILVVSEAGLPVARLYQRELGDAVIYATSEWNGCERIASHKDFLEAHFAELARVIFIGALGICVRSIAGCIKDKYHDPAVVCVEPPRKGLAEDVVETIATMAPQRVVYVSCDPGTLGRDVKRFGALGYRAARAAAVDMFPRTAHVETVALLEKE